MSDPARRFGFFTERQVGIGSAAGAIEPYIRAAGHGWTDVTYVREQGRIEKLTFLPPRVKGTLRGFYQVKEGLAQGPYAGLLFLTHNPAVFHPTAIKNAPTVLWTDVTPVQLDEQAEQYAHTVTKSSIFQDLKDRAVRRTFQGAAALVGWSNWARGSFIKDYGVPEQRTHVVHPGVDLAKFTVFREPKPPGLPRLLFVGGDFERKGGSLLLSVFREHFQGRALLDIVTRDAVPASPGVTVHHGLTPNSPGLLELYRNASAFVLPTRGDCFSIASLEAMAMGLPVVVGNVGGIADIVDPGKTGHLVLPGDGSALRAALEHLLASEQTRQSMGIEGRHVVEAKFDARLTAAALIRCLEGVATGR
jgi:glycosyltransferase involved in cell wall biosynthesis